MKPYLNSFSDEEIKTQEGQVIGTRSCCQNMAEAELGGSTQAPRILALGRTPYSFASTLELIESVSPQHTSPLRGSAFILKTLPLLSLRASPVPVSHSFDSSVLANLQLLESGSDFWELPKIRVMCGEQGELRTTTF